MKEDLLYYKGKSSLTERFFHAFRGIRYAWQKEPNFRIEVFFALAVLGAMTILPLQGVERAILVIATSFVLILEVVNSVFERMLDITHPHISQEVKRVKDTMAGAVLLASATSVAVAGLILTRPLLVFDIYFQELLANARTHEFVQIAKAVTILGDWEVFLVVSLPLVFFLLYRKQYEMLGFFIGSTIIGQIFLFVLKILVARERPPGIELVEANGYSFPSGHVFFGTVFWFALGYIATNAHRERKYLWAVPILFVLLIAASRVILSVHWLSDVAGGFLFGLFWILLWFGINQRLFRGKSEA